jgi:hypothetical protein
MYVYICGFISRLSCWIPRDLRASPILPYFWLSTHSPIECYICVLHRSFLRDLNFALWTHRLRFYVCGFTVSILSPSILTEFILSWEWDFLRKLLFHSFWDVTPYSLVDRYQFTAGTWFFHLQGRWSKNLVHSSVLFLSSKITAFDKRISELEMVSDGMVKKSVRFSNEVKLTDWRIKSCCVLMVVTVFNECSVYHDRTYLWVVINSELRPPNSLTFV